MDNRHTGVSDSVIFIHPALGACRCHKIDLIINDFHFKTLGAYWDKEREYVDKFYTTIPFPFYQYNAPDIYIKAKWTLKQLLGYLASWSAVQHYKNKHGEDPLQTIVPALQQLWDNEEQKDISFQIFMKVGKIEK